jgi:outer membrane protein OmpA-like peptidoglycan-associated protein
MERPRVEDELAGNVRRLLTARQIDWATVTFKGQGRDGVLTGEALSEAERKEARDIALSVDGVRSIDDRSIIGAIGRYSWNAHRVGNSLWLRGLVPSENDRKAMIAAAQRLLPNIKITDATRIQRGVKNREAWLNGTNLGFRQLRHLSSGKVEISNEKFSVSGIARTSEEYVEARRELRSLPPGLKLASERIAAPTVKPYVWSAEWKGGELVLAGFAPSERLREEVLADAKRRFPGKRINDQRFLIAEGAPEGWQKATAVALEQLARLVGGRAQLSDTHLTFNGEAVEEATAEGVSRLVVSQLPAGFRTTEKVTFQKPRVPIVRPYTTTAVLNGRALVLTGHYPSEELHQKAIATARRMIASVTIDDRMKLASGEPVGWLQCLETGFVGMSRAGNGRFEMTDRSAVLTATAANEAMANEIRGDIRAAQSVCSAEARVTVPELPEPDLNWSATWSGSEIVLDGEVPDKRVQEALLADARKAMPGTRVVDRMRVTAGKWETWERVARFGLASALKLTKGEARITGKSLRVTGEAASYETADAISVGLENTIPRGYIASETISVRAGRSRYQETEEEIEQWWKRRRTEPPKPPQPSVIVPPPPSAAVTQELSKPPVVAVAPPPPAPPKRTEADICQELLASTAKEGVIRFEKRKANLDPASFPTLNKLADVMKQCSKVVVDIEGHTDSDGSARRNEELSQERAAAVVAYLASRGIKLDRLNAVGYGARHPIATNDTDENKAKNRRIEFTVKSN